MQRLQDEDEDLRRIGQTSSPIPSYCQADVAISIPRDESSISVSRTSQPEPVRSSKFGSLDGPLPPSLMFSKYQSSKSDHLDKHGLYPHFKARWAMMCIIGVCVKSLNLSMMGMILSNPTGMAWFVRACLFVCLTDYYNLIVYYL